MTGSTTDTAKWIRRFQPAPEATARLVCFPHAGGAASYYFSVAKRLAPAIEVLAVQYPGRQDRRTEPCAESVQELAEQAQTIGLSVGVLQQRSAQGDDQQLTAIRHLHAHSDLAGTRISRWPLPLMALTSPAFSMSSTRRAARL